MNINIKHVATVIIGFRWAMLAVAMVCILVLDLPNVGIAVALFVLLFGLAMRFEKFRVWIVGWLTGLGADVVQAARDQHKAAAQTGAAQPRPQTPTQQPPKPTQDKRALDVIVARERQEAVLLKRHWPPTAPAPQNSWLGGLPALPDGVDWPLNADTGLALHHLAQIDLAEMPRPDGQADLPQTGMLWFFADIAEDMDWMGGQDQQYSRVLYHPDSTKGLAQRAAPETLPYVDHRSGSLDPNPISYRSPPRRVYPKWPVTGHVSGAWPFSYAPPEGVTDSGGYYQAQEGAKDAERATILGEKAEESQSTAFVVSTHRVTGTRPNGEEYLFSKGVYLPKIFGGHFPYNNHLGAMVLARMAHKMDCDLRRAQRLVEMAQARDEPAGERERDMVEKIGPLYGRVTALQKTLGAQTPTGAPSAAAHAEFDTLIEDCVEDLTSKSYVVNALHGGIGDLVGDAMEQPDLLAGVPDEVIEHVHRTVLPSHHYTNHYLLGPKGGETNPTAGFGVRLAQFDSDYALGFMFCDCGVVDFWISEEDLAAGRWDKAWAGTAGG